MKPLDPRLLKHARAARSFILLIGILGTIVSVLVIAQAFLIAKAASAVIDDGASLTAILPTIGALAGVIITRGALIYWRESRAHRAADQVMAQLREAVVAKSVSLGPRWRARYGADTVTLVTRGLDDLDPYFVRYLPQLIMMVTVTPIALVTVLILDFWSALVALVTIPLIPIFMALIGRLTEASSKRKLVAMERLGSQLLDVLTGLPTLRALGREKGPRHHLVSLSAQNTRTTMETLRIAFLSGGVLEFLATLSVALVAVEVGFRMVGNNLSLFVGLVIIMLAPEVYEPLRQVGAHFHASANGVAAANACFEILEEPEPASGNQPAGAVAGSAIVFDDLSVAARGTWAPAELTATIEPGTITALSGPSGAGKTTAAMVLLGLEQATRGAIKVGGTNLTDVDLESWRKGITWVPQSPTIVAGTVAENLDDGADSRRRDYAAKLTGFDKVVAELPNGWQTFLGSGGVGLSVGQRQRLAITRALLDPSQLVVLDEPTAHLDAVSEEQVVQILKELQRGGATVLVIAHRQAVLAMADHVIPIETSKATATQMEEYPQLSESLETSDMRVELPTFLDAKEIQGDLQGESAVAK